MSDNINIAKNAWTKLEDRQLKSLVEEWEKKFEPKHSWIDIAQNLPGRTSEQCRKRWRYKLDPCLKQDIPWTNEEDTLLLKLQAEVGNKWAMIGKIIKGRSDVDVKNRFFSAQRKRKIEDGEQEIRRCLQISTSTDSSLPHLTQPDYNQYQKLDRHPETSSNSATNRNSEYVHNPYPQLLFISTYDANMNLYYNSMSNVRPPELSFENTNIRSNCYARPYYH